ncbi:MAG TPA: hypothetical protein VE223_03900 [Nitrososphaeraceae archaeon]|nr:hypothetical protein [Nitrososphaeraceae archaeon]
MMEKGLKQQNFDNIQSYIEDTGEVNWLIQDALNICNGTLQIQN